MDLNGFPMELWPYILSNLDLMDLIRCRAVNRTFKQASEEVKLKEVDVKGLNPILLFSSTFKFHRHLKRLCLQGNFGKFDSAILDPFPQLVSLYIAGYLTNLGEAITLNLPELTEFTFNEYHGYEGGAYSFRLNTPKLKHLSVPDLNKVNLTHPEALIQLDCDICDLKVRDCKNLQVLKCNRFLELRHVYGEDDDLLRQLPELKELHLNMACLESDYDNFSEYRHAMEALIDYLRERETLNRFDLKITLRNVLIVDSDQLYGSSYGLLLSPYNWQLKNYRLLLDEPQFDYAVSFNWADYSYVQDQIGDRMLRGGFLEKSRISRVETLNHILNPDDFLWFLKQLPKLDSLKLRNAPSFYPKLTELTDLKMLSVYVYDGPPFDLSLVFKFNKLEQFETDSKYSVEILDFIRAAFVKGSRLNEFKCRVNRSDRVEIKKEISSRRLVLSISKIRGSCELSFCPSTEMRHLWKVIETILFFSDTE